MTTGAITSRRLRTWELRPGDAITIAGTGTFAVRKLIPIPGEQVVIALAWDNLAVIATAGDTWDATVLAPRLPRLARRRTCPACGGTGRDPADFGSTRRDRSGAPGSAAQPVRRPGGNR
jgi:hypothetical protein